MKNPLSTNQNSPNYIQTHSLQVGCKFSVLFQKIKDASFTYTFASFFFKILSSLTKSKSKHVLSCCEEAWTLVPVKANTV